MEKRFESAPGREPGEQFCGLIESVSALSASLWRNQVGDRMADHTLMIGDTIRATRTAAMADAPRQTPLECPDDIQQLALSRYNMPAQELMPPDIDQLLVMRYERERAHWLRVFPEAYRPVEQARLDINEKMADQFGTLSLTEQQFRLRSVDSDGLVLTGRTDSRILDLEFSAADPNKAEDPFIRFRDTYDTPLAEAIPLKNSLMNDDSIGYMLGAVNERLAEVHDALVYEPTYQWPEA